MVHALEPVRRERVQKRPPDTHRIRPERDGFEHVVRTAHTAIDEQLELLVGELEPTPLAELAHDLDEDLEPRALGVELPTAMIGEHDALHARLVREHRVLSRANTLQDDRHYGERWRMSMYIYKERRGEDALLVMLWNQGMSFQSSPGSMNDCRLCQRVAQQVNDTALTLIARAAPCERSTLLSWLLPVTSAGSSASNFCRMSWSRHRCQSPRPIPGNRSLKGDEEIRGQTDLLTTAELGSVDGDEERLDAALLGVLHELLRDFAVLVHVPKVTVSIY